MTPTILTATGRYFDLLDPEQCGFHIEEIAHALSHLCRFTGHVREFYSVAQHCALVSLQVPAEHRLAALLHDAAEAYVGDVSAPLKSLLPDYKAIEGRIERALLRAYGLDEVLPLEVKAADLVLLNTERRDLMPRDGRVWTSIEGVGTLNRVIKPMRPDDARDWYLFLFEAYFAQHEQLLAARLARAQRAVDISARAVSLGGMDSTPGLHRIESGEEHY